MDSSAIGEPGKWESVTQAEAQSNENVDVKPDIVKDIEHVYADVKQTILDDALAKMMVNSNY